MHCEKMVLKGKSFGEVCNPDRQKRGGIEVGRGY